MISIPCSLEASSETFPNLAPLQHPKAPLYREQDPILIWPPAAPEASSLCVPSPLPPSGPSHWHCLNLSEAPCCSLCTPCCFPTPRLLPYLKYRPRLVCLSTTYLSVMRQFTCCLPCDAFPYPHPHLSHQKNQTPHFYAAITMP